jgi:hypothetical protein
MKTLKVIQDIRVYRSITIDSDHYLCAKVNYPTRALNKNLKISVQKKEFSKIGLLNDESRRWPYTQRVKLHLNNIKTNETDVEKESEKLQKY